MCKLDKCAGSRASRPESELIRKFIVKQWAMKDRVEELFDNCLLHDP